MGEESACVDTWERIPLQTDHLKMSKFTGPTDRCFQSVATHIRTMCNGAKEWMERKTGESIAREVGEKRHFLVPFGRIETFVGREAVLDRLLTRLLPAAYRHDCQRTAIEGLGGVGKTQLALEAAYRVRDAHPDCSVFWVPAVDLASLDKAYREIGQALGVKGLDGDEADVRVLVHAALGQDDAGPWLWIIDNADDRELLFGKQAALMALPFNQNGSVLVTTRNHEVAIRLDVPQPGLLSIEAMPRPESSKLLGQGLNEDQIRDTASTNALLDFLADLPLAVRQASAYMSKTGISTVRYLTHCQSGNEALLKLLSKDFSDRGRYEAVCNPVATTWLISFEHIARDAPLAADHLRFISFLSEKDIPKLLLPVGDDELEADEALGTLKAYAFINERMDTGRFDIHRLVRLTMHNWLAEKGEQAVWLTRVIKRLDEIYPPPEHENMEVWIRYLPHVQATFETCVVVTDGSTKSHLLFKAGESCNILGQYAEAEMMHRKALELRTQVLGAEHPNTLTSKNGLASVLHNLGQYAEARTMYHEVLNLRTQKLGAEHPDTLTSKNGLASILYSLRQYSEAEAMYREVLNLSIQKLGAEHPDTLTGKNNLASTLYSLRQHDEAEAMYREVLNLRTQKLGAEHPDTLTRKNNLAAVLRSLGQYTEAEMMYREVLVLHKEVLGAKHPDTLNCRNNFAWVLGNLGQYTEAEAIYREVLKLYKEVLGAEHPKMITSKNNLALVLRRLGRYAEAEAMHREALDLSTKVLGAEHPSTLRIKSNLTTVLEMGGQVTSRTY